MVTSPRRCPKCKSTELESVYVRGQRVLYNGRPVYECPRCSRAWPETSLEPVPERPFSERGEIEREEP